MTVERERRKHHRRKVDLPVEFQVGDGPSWHARLRAMSIGGSFIETGDPQPFGTKLVLTFRLPNSGTDTKVSAVVRWTSTEGMGVQFSAFRAREMYLLTAFLADKPPQSLRPPPSPKSPAAADGSQRTAEAQPPITPPNARLRTHRSDLDPLGQDLDRRAKRLDQRASGEVQESELEQELKKRDEQLARLQENLRQRDAELAGLRTELRQSNERSTQLEAKASKLAEQLTDEQARLAQRADRIDELQATVRQHEAQLAEARKAPPPPDDLTRIKGIGPKSARALMERGICRLEQIAAWTSADIEEAARHLKVTPARIEKAGWVASAAELLAEPDET